MSWPIHMYMYGRMSQVQGAIIIRLLCIESFPVKDIVYCNAESFFTFKLAWILHVPKFGSSQSGKSRQAKSANTKVIHRQQPAGGEGLVTRLLVPLHLRKLMQACEQIVY